MDWRPINCRAGLLACGYGLNKTGQTNCCFDWGTPSVLDITSTNNALILPVRASPGSKRDAIVGEHAGALKVAVTAPPDKGKANAAIVELLSEVLKLPKSNFSLLSGATSRQKKFSIAGIDQATLLERLAPALGS